jgi:putative acetyltransferase
VEIRRESYGSAEHEARRLGRAARDGNQQPEALRLYASAGYEPIARYAPYEDDERSVCFGKRL